MDITASGCPDTLYSVGYRGIFDPSNVCTGWAGDTGDVVGSGSSYSFIVTRGNYFTIVVHEATPNAGCLNYVINIRTSLFCSEITTTTPTPTITYTPGPSPTATMTSSPTQTTGTPTPVVSTPTATACTIQFTDVPVGHTFYDSVRCLACRGIVSGYSDGTFRPNNQVTRGQLAKMVSNAAGFTEDPNPQICADVPPTQTFYEWINRLTRRGHMTGYQCG